MTTMYIPSIKVYRTDIYVRCSLMTKAVKYAADGHPEHLLSLSDLIRRFKTTLFTLGLFELALLLVQHFHPATNLQLPLLYPAFRLGLCLLVVVALSSCSSRSIYWTLTRHLSHTFPLPLPVLGRSTFTQPSHIHEPETCF